MPLFHHLLRSDDNSSFYLYGFLRENVTYEKTYVEVLYGYEGVCPQEGLGLRACTRTGPLSDPQQVSPFPRPTNPPRLF